jgi:N-acetylmuramoyl-L-alanine amidase
MSIITIDPGHGGSAMTGGSSPNNATGPNGALEKDLTLSIALDLRTSLQNAGHNVSMTRDSDINLGLADRAKVASNTGAQAFISIHFNGNNDPTIQGTETLTHLVCTGDSTLLAQSIQQRVVGATGYRDRGVKTQQLGVLSLNSQSIATACCLAELSFLTDPNEESRLVVNAAYRAGLVAALAAGIADYLANASGSVPENPQTTPDPVPGSDA